MWVRPVAWAIGKNLGFSEYVISAQAEMTYQGLSGGLTQWTHKKMGAHRAHLSISKRLTIR